MRAQCEAKIQTGLELKGNEEDLSDVVLVRVAAVLVCRRPHQKRHVSVGIVLIPFDDVASFDARRDLCNAGRDLCDAGRDLCNAQISVMLEVL